MPFQSQLKTLIAHSIAKSDAAIGVKASTGELVAVHENGDEFVLGTGVGGQIPLLEDITELRATTGSTNLEVAVVRCHTNEGDGGGGVFIWSDTVATDDGGTIFNAGGLGTTTAGWRRQYTGPLSVRWFGATGDGTTDDTTAIQRTMNRSFVTGNAVFVPKGVYRLTDSLTVTQTSGNPEGLNFEMFGENAVDDVISSTGSGAILKWDGDASTPMLELLTRGCKIHKLGFEVAAGKTALSAIDWDYGGAGGYIATNPHFYDLSIYGHETERRFTDGIVFGRSVAINNLEFAVLRNVHIVGCSSACFRVMSNTLQSKSHVIDRCNFLFAAYGVYLQSGSVVATWINPSYLDTAFYLVQPTDTVRLSNVNSEGCTRLLQHAPGGGGTYPWLVVIENMRAALNNMHADGYFIIWGALGGLELRQCDFQPSSNSDRLRFRIKTGAFIRTQGCIFPNRTPISYFGGTSGWASSGDWGIYIDGTGYYGTNPYAPGYNWWPLPSRVFSENLVTSVDDEGAAGEVLISSGDALYPHTFGVVGSAIHWNEVEKITTATAAFGDHVLADTGGGAWTLTLPAVAASSGKRICVTKVTSDAAAVTIEGDAPAETINGEVSFDLTAQWQTVTLVSTGTEWLIESRSAYGDVEFDEVSQTAAVIGGVRVSSGTGSPEGAVVGSVGDLFLRTNGANSTTIYSKASGAGTNTGWTALLADGAAASLLSADVTSTVTIGGVTISSGTGSPEGLLVGAVGDVFLRTDGAAGTTTYLKVTGVADTGWIPITTIAGLSVGADENLYYTNSDTSVTTQLTP